MTRSRKIAAPLTLLAVCGLAWLAARIWDGGSPNTSDAAPAVRQPPPADEPVDVTPRLMSRIEPGTEISDGPPEGWSHLVLHAVSRVAEGDIEKVSTLVSGLVSRFHLTILADAEAVEGSRPPRYRLDRVAIGLALPIDETETIVTAKRQKELGAELGFVDRNALTENEASLDGVRQVARTSTMLVFDAPSVMRLENKNRHVTQRHAILVSPTTGRLATLVWIVAKGEGEALRLVAPEAQLLPENFEDDRTIYADASQFTLGIPNKQAFALVALPQGTPTPISENWRDLAVSRFKESTDVVKLEQALRAALGWNKEVNAR